MKFSYNWLKELSGTDKTAQEIAEILIVHSFEVEDVIEQGKDMGGVAVGEILSIEKHPDADKLSIAKVDVGEDEPRQIVFGQMVSMEVGLKVPVALAPTMLPGGVKIKRSKLRGVESQGMLCLDQELGLEKEGVSIHFFDKEVKNGMPFVQAAHMDDTILDIDILPNRAHDSLSYEGMAREIAALEGRRIVFDADDDNIKASGDLDVAIQTDLCTRYIGMQLKGVQVKESPAWLKSRLKASDIGSINNVVDITNYVMLLTGQPLHAFDSKALLRDNEDKLKIVVRKAQQEEKIMLLDDSEKVLNDENVVIADAERSIALAGVMGGKGSGVTDATNEVILESAHFDASTIRKTRVHHGLITDAAHRFERDIDPNLAAHAIGMAVKLLENIAGAEVVSVRDEYPSVVHTWKVDLHHSDIEKLLGIKMKKEDVMGSLQNLSIDIEEHEGVYTTQIPTFRRDLKIAADLIEEIGRVYGYEKIRSKPLEGRIESSFVNEERQFDRSTKDILVSYGFNEIYSYSFYSRKDAQQIGLDDEMHVQLLNPMSEEQEYMRRSLVPGLMRASARNLSYENEMYIFEIGREYSSTNEGLPTERSVCGLAYTSKNDDGLGFSILKGAVESYLERLSIKGISFSSDFSENDQNTVDLHPSRKAMILTKEGVVLGVIGEVSKKAHKYFGVKKARTVICELDLENVKAIMQSEMEYEPLGKYPGITRDLSMKVEARTRVADVERVLYAAGGQLLKDVDLFDLYIEPESQERSMAFRCMFRSDERTLQAKEVDEAINNMVLSLEKELNIEIRK